MRYLIIALLVTVCFTLSAQEFKISTPEGNVSMSITGVQSNGTTTSGNLIDQIAVKMEQLEKEVHIKLNKIDQKKAENLMNEIYGLLALLPTNQTVTVGQTVTSSSGTSTSTPSSGTVNINMNISGMDENTDAEPVETHKTEKVEKPTEVATPAKASRKTMPESEFGSLISRINAESFSDNKLRVLRTAAKNYKFSCNQINRLIDAFEFSNEKLEALRIAYPEVTDPENNYKILDAFTYSNDKEQADSIINQ